ncbi:hypothetical protein S7711_10339 [Stachybotrys chartarum IBT 7711]|uniref:Uncharacterized protein n=1 Tax=Stachybotrys chartarum (strain CBS 109288 / IBT 7711) TaxID=1280523 RepID=A0A084B3K1_STACB|nr:hypothetical protein S7711_10339 [Stachybotrys chartarum IBT 7711]
MCKELTTSAVVRLRPTSAKPAKARVGATVYYTAVNTILKIRGSDSPPLMLWEVLHNCHLTQNLARVKLNPCKASVQCKIGYWAR